MMVKFSKIINHGIDSENLNWDSRNLRFMNAMAFVMAASMLMFACFVTAFGVYEDLVLLAIAFILCILHFFNIKFFNYLFAKIYFTIMPVLIVTMFSVFAAGEAGNDKYYIFCSSIIPLILFRKKWIYILLFLFNFVMFFVIEVAQQYVVPIAYIAPDQLVIYKTLNIVMIFTFTYFLLKLFKNEIFGYQKEIEQKNEIIEEKNEEVKQSIEYAKRIQEAILPPKAFQEKYLPHSFVLYQPKDIVAGDFYWIEHKGSKVFFAAADCTGHGVPGAMVSVVCHNALNQALHEYNLTDPGQILDKTRELVIQTFDRSDQKVKDGMDIGLCSFDRENNQLNFSGANNGMYLLRNGELNEVKPDKEPIGYYDSPSPFTTTRIELQQNDIVYLFTDGFADQFGGEKGKKYKYKPFKRFLQSLEEIEISEHSARIREEFERWKGDLEQVDDVCIIGVKF
ncbi:MAG: SpoIIE family protein phosphatase [Crocinitomicaceae bacterium]|nr:SpoIIE family protein phosphatase [Crocinitomicaceae bacterium]